MAPPPGGPQVGTLPTLDEMDTDPLGWHDPVNQRQLVETPHLRHLVTLQVVGSMWTIDCIPHQHGGGDRPEKQFKEYHRNLLLWLVEAEARLLHNLMERAS